MFYCQYLSVIIINDITRTESNHDNSFDIVFDVVSLAASIYDVCNNPDDPWAWVGLAGDVVDVLIPCVGGIGEITKAVSKGKKAIDAVDDVHDAAKVVDNVGDAAKATKKGWKVGDDITNLTKAGNTPAWSTVRQRFWKNEAHFNPSNYSPDNISRMKKGLAPLDNMGISYELHHPNGRVGDNFFNFVPVTQNLHRKLHYGGF